MKTRFYSSLLLLGLAALPQLAQAQTDTNGCTPNAFNLLPDPGFENQKVSPLSGDRFNVGGGPESSWDELTNWKTANHASPDYFATNQGQVISNPSYSDIQPFTPLDGINPNTRNGTVGIGTSIPGYLEYITPTAPITFAKGGAYYASFWAYRVYSPSPFAYNNYTGSTPLGMALANPASFGGSYTSDITISSLQRYPVFISGIIGANAPQQWTHVGGVIDGVQAGQAYQVIVGNFSSGKYQTNDLSYYYLDNVTLYRIPTAGPPTVASTCGAAVAIGEGDPIPCATYSWSSSANDLTAAQANQLLITVTPRVQTTYTLTVTMPGQAGGLVYKTSQVVITPSQATPAATFAGPVLPTSLCLSNGFQDYNLYVNNMPGATGYTWTLAPAGQASIIFGNGTNHVLVHFPVGNYTTTVSVVANYPCGNSTPIATSTRVSNGPPAYPQLTQDDPMQWLGYNQAKFFINNYSSDVKYTVYNIQWANPTSPPGFSRPDFIVKGGGGHSNDYEGYFYIVAENACGSVTSGTFAVTYLMNVPRATPVDNAQAYPNPATEALTLPADAQHATLLNMQGQPVLQTEVTGPLKVDRLPAGLYNLQFYHKGKLVNQRIEVKH